MTNSVHRREIELPCDGPYDITHALETYIIYPWIREEDALVRILRCGREDAIIKAEIRQHGTIRSPKLRAVLKSSLILSPKCVVQVRDKLVWCLSLRDSMGKLYRLSQKDPVLQCALNHRGFGRGKLYPDLFEGICGVVCAQRMAFRRIYQMMLNLAMKFGPSMRLEGKSYWAFPLPSEVHGHQEEEIRSCGLGYRAKYIAGIAATMAEEPLPYTEWHKAGIDVLREKLMQLPGVGEYTANLVISLVYRPHSHPHVDSYVRSILSTLYLKGRKLDDAAASRFIARRWGSLGEDVLDLLTTDPDIWTASLEVEMKVRSGARTKT